MPAYVSLRGIATLDIRNNNHPEFCRMLLIFVIRQNAEKINRGHHIIIFRNLALLGTR